MSDLQTITDNVKEKVPELIKNNKGALIGAIVGFFLTDSKQAQSTILGAIAGAVVVDNAKKEEE